MLRPAHRGTELAARPKPFGVRSLTTGVKEAVCGSAAYRRRVKRWLRLLGCAIGVRYASDSTPILQPQSDTRERNVYVLFVFFVAKQRPAFASSMLRRGKKENEQ